MIGVIDYGAGNLASVIYAFNRVGVDAEVVTGCEQASRYHRLVLPGVGSFRLAMQRLRESGWDNAIRCHVQSGKPILGICLGMQLLFDRGQEDGGSTGLGLIPGSVEVLSPRGSLRLPHVGWNGLCEKREHPVLDGVKDHVDFYFVHSYHCVPNDESVVISRVDYGGYVVAGVALHNVIGMQFHPEKSQPAGLRILQNFAEWSG